MTSASRRIDLTIPPSACPSGWLVTAQSYLVNRFTPDCEFIALPERPVGGGKMVLRLETARLEPPRSRRPRLLAGGVEMAPPGRILYDVRDKFPSNWAHFLDDHLPVLFHAIAQMGLDRTQIIIVLPANIPDYICRAADLFGFEVWKTDAVVTGEALIFEGMPGTVIRAERARWVKTPWVTEIVAAATSSGPPLPPRVFLSRRQTRAPSNETEVEEFLASMGFVKVYPEDLSVADQFRLFREAETIVAVHGAGLAPLLYAPEGGSLRHLVEIMPCGHMADVFRVVAHQVGVDWIGVRGRMKPEYVRPAYAIGTPFKTYSLDDFEVDTKALAKAFELANHATENALVT